MIKQFLKFESKLKITPFEASILLGIKLNKYKRLKSGELEGKKLFNYSISAHMLIDRQQIISLIRTRKWIISKLEYPNLRGRYNGFTFLEDMLQVGPTKASKFIGLDYERYNEFKTRTVRLQFYHIYAFEAYKYLSDNKINQLKTKRLKTC